MSAKVPQVSPDDRGAFRGDPVELHLEMTLLRVAGHLKGDTGHHGSDHEHEKGAEETRSAFSAERCGLRHAGSSGCLLPFDEEGDSLPSPDTGAGNTPLGPPALHLQTQGEQETGPGGPQGMSQRDRPSVDIDSITLQPEVLSTARYWPANASLISNRSMSARVRFARSRTLRMAGAGPMPISLGIYAHVCPNPPTRASGSPERLLGRGFVRHHQRSRAVHDAARVALPSPCRPC